MNHNVLLLGLLLGSTALAPPAGAQRSDARVRSDIAFARGLAERFRYVDMAEGLILELEDAGVSAELRGELGLAKCDVYAEGARREPDKDKRLQLSEKAVQAYLDYIEANPFSELRSQAERSYVDLVNSYGNVLRVALDDMVGDEAAKQREKIKGVLEDALSRIGDLLDPLKEASDADELGQAERNEYNRLRLNRGQMLLTFAEVSEQGTFLYGRAEETLVDLALEEGETSGWGLNAFMLLAKVKAAQGEYGEAATFAEFVVDVVLPSDPATREAQGWAEMSAEMKARRWEMAERATKDLVESYAASSSPNAQAQALQWALHYFNNWKRDGYTMSPVGYLSLVSVARVLMNSGGVVGGVPTQGNLRWFETEDAAREAGFGGRREQRSAVDLALEVAQQINDDNKGNILQVYAQKLISEIIGRPGVRVDPEILFQAAQGEYYAQEFHTAIEALRRVMRALDAQDEAIRREYSAKVLYFLGKSFSRLDRPLEAAMAHREAVKTWSGDPEYDPKNAKGYYDAIVQVHRASNDDPALRALRDDAGQEVIENPGGDDGGVDAIVWNRGQRHYDEDDFAKAREEYLKVTPGGRYYERAVAKAALCLYKQKQYEQASQEFRKYLDDYVTDPKNAVTADAQKAARQEATAQATYYLGVMAWSQNDYEQVIEWLAGYHEAFPEQTSYGPNALYMVLNSYLARKDFEQAKAVHAKMREHFPESTRTGTGAGKIYEVLKQEQAKAEAEGSVARASELKAEMAEMMRISNNLASSPNFNNLRTESVLFMELERWADAEQTLRKIVAAFGDDPSQKKSVDNFVKPDLGQCLLAQKEIPAAFEVLDPLVPDPDDESDTRKPSSSVVTLWCRSVAGWVEGDARTIVEVPGVGGAENLAKACKYWEKLTGLAERDHDWECPWFQAKFETAYAYYQWGQIDSQQYARSQTLIRDLRQVGGDPELAFVEESCGDDVLRRRLLWLWGKVQ